MRLLCIAQTPSPQRKMVSGGPWQLEARRFFAQVSPNINPPTQSGSLVLHASL